MRKPTMRLPLAAVAGAGREAAQLLVLLSLLGLAMQGLGAALSVPAVSPAVAVAPGTALRGLSTAGLHALRPAIAQPAQQPQPAAGSLRRDGDLGWWIHPGTLTRAELAAQLAEASGSRLRGDLLQPEARLPAQSLRLPSSEAAWRWLLDARQGYALRCAGLRCELWLTTAAAQPTTVSVPAPLPADPPGLFPAEPPPEPG
jgi:hypothetical protein